MSITATFILQMIVFLILVGFTMKYIWPPITAALDARAKKIAVMLMWLPRALIEPSERRGTGFAGPLALPP